MLPESPVVDNPSRNGYHPTPEFLWVNSCWFCVCRESVAVTRRKEGPNGSDLGQAPPRIFEYVRTHLTTWTSEIFGPLKKNGDPILRGGKEEGKVDRHLPEPIKTNQSLQPELRSRTQEEHICSFSAFFSRHH